MDSIPRRPALRYHGGKWKLASWILGYFPPHRVYVESYGGGASVLLQKPRAYAEVYNDLAGEIVNVFRVLRNPTQARELQRLIELTPFAREEFELSYLADGDPIEQARRTIMRSFMGFGSAAHNPDHKTGFRSDSNRSGTTPAHDWLHYPINIPDFTQRLTGVVIENRPALDVIQQYDKPQTLHYVDPPYPLSTRGMRARNKCYQFEITEDDHHELSKLLHQVDGYVVLSSYPSPMYDELYKGWQSIEKQTQGNGNTGAMERTEVLWLSPRTSEALQAGAGLPLFTLLHS